MKPSSAAWHTQSADQVLSTLQSSPQGLSSEEAQLRLATQGPNQLRESTPLNLPALFFNQFKSLIVGLLVIAGIVAGSLGEWVDTIAILSIVLLNGVIGFYQEYQAEKSIAALRKLTAPQCRVRRNNRSATLDATQLVSGDLVELEAGDCVPADCRILDSASLQCVESALTGESETVEKSAATLTDMALPLADRVNLLFKGTIVSAGRATAVVVATGMNTELGRIAGLIEEADAPERTPLQEKLEVFGRFLVWASLGIVALLFLLGLIRGMPFMELFMTSVSLAVAAVPEGLPAVVTLALGLGVMRMSRRKALVRKLPSVETLGSTNVICTDKTGTLTVGDMTVRELVVAGQSYQVTGEGYGPYGEIRINGKNTGLEHAGPLLEIATSLLACNNAELVLESGAWQVIGDPTEGALLVAGHKAGARRESIEENLPKHHEIPFDSERKRRTVIRRMPEGQLRAFVNGAPDILLKRCNRIYTESGILPLTDSERTRLAAQNERMASQALRVLGSAYRDLPPETSAREVTESVEHDLIFVGLAGMYDPPRPGAAQAVRRCHDAGIEVVMITGDHPHTALAIARDLGIASAGATVITGVELEGMSEDELKQIAPATRVYARVSAEHKLRIVRAWTSNGAVVAMTGDGVNDAPALRGADIGIAMGIKGTEVTKQASDMVITDDNFETIVSAVEQGRGVFENIRKTLQYLLAGNIAELLLMTLAILIGLPSPLLPIHLLWINLVTDGLPALCLAADPLDPTVMNRKPRKRSEAIMDRGFILRVVLAGGITASVCLGFFYWALSRVSVEAARSMTFTVLVFCELFKSIAFRSETLPLWKMPLHTHSRLALIIAGSIVLQLLLHHVGFLSRILKTVTPAWTDRWILLMLGLIPLVLLELAKWIRRDRNAGRSEP